MIARLKGKLIEKTGQNLLLDVGGLCYEVLVPAAVFSRIDDHKDEAGCVQLVIYHYLQMDPSRGVPVMIGFLNELEKDFFLQFISVSGIGPRAAIKAINKPISDITRAIDENDVEFLKSLPGIGTQRAKDIVARLQGKISRFGLLREKEGALPKVETPDWQQEALAVLLQLQYKRPEALAMIERVLKRTPGVESAQELLNEIYKQKVSP
jgi:holliday junction DNA helicase RuvA